jgi:hypothetical protein
MNVYDWLREGSMRLLRQVVADAARNEALHIRTGELLA